MMTEGSVLGRKRSPHSTHLPRRGVARACHPFAEAAPRGERAPRHPVRTREGGRASSRRAGGRPAGGREGVQPEGG
eukprot:3467021-Prymnesium_polylepis.1